MSNSSNIGMMINHIEVNHLIVSLSDALRNTAYKVANQIAPKGSSKHLEFFDEDGTLIGYDTDTNTILIRDCLDHYLQYANAYGDLERSDFAYYLQTNFEMIAAHVLGDQQLLAYMTALFSSACGILSSVLEPVMQDIYNRGQMIEKIESFVTGPENTYYLIYGDDIDNPETYDPKEDDLSDVDVSQPAEVTTRQLIIQDNLLEMEEEEQKIIDSILSNSTLSASVTAAAIPGNPYGIEITIDDKYAIWQAPGNNLL